MSSVVDPLVLLPDSGIQVMATPAGLTSGNRSMWPANLSLQVCNLGPISYHFLDKWRFLVSRVLNTPSDLGRRKRIYIAKVPYTQGAQVRITQCYLQTTPYLPLVGDIGSIFRSTSKSRPNNIRGRKKCPSVHPSVRPQKVSSISMKFGI